MALKIVQLCVQRVYRQEFHHMCLEDTILTLCFFRIVMMAKGFGYILASKDVILFSMQRFSS